MWDGVEGGEGWTSFVLLSVYTCMIMSTRVCVRATVGGENSPWWHVGKCKEVYAARDGRGRVSKSGGEVVGREGRGVNFDVSFLKLSFDNWQFVQLVKCQESKKIDEVHNRCLRLTLRCGLESHARIRPPKRYRNEISHMHTKTHSQTYTHTNRYTHLTAGEHLWYGKLAHVNLVGVDFCLNTKVSFKWWWPLTEGL